jgi:hypothetical protein
METKLDGLLSNFQTCARREISLLRLVNRFFDLFSTGSPDKRDSKEFVEDEITDFEIQEQVLCQNTKTVLNKLACVSYYVNNYHLIMTQLLVTSISLA